MPIRGRSWDADLAKRGSFRNYSFDNALLPQGTVTAGATRSVNSPTHGLYTGAAGVTPANLRCETVEVKQGNNFSDIWTGIDGLNYWGRRHRMVCYMGMGLSQVIPIGGRIYAGIFLQAPNGLGQTCPPVPANPNKPMCILWYARNGFSEATPDERWELITAKGDGSAVNINRLTGVDGPRSDISAGGQRTQRLEILYEPGIAVYALIDGKLGATNTTGIPDTTTVPAATQNMAGVAVYGEQVNAGDYCRANFHGLILESWR